MTNIFKPPRDETRRWYYPDRKRAVTLYKWLFPLIGMGLALGIIIMLLIYFIVLPSYQRSQDIKIITSIILESNPDFDPIFAKAAAEYTVDNSGNYDPVLIAWMGRFEGCWVKNIVTSAGAEGYFGIIAKGNDRKLKKSQRTGLQYQLDRAIEHLDEFYEMGHCIKKEKKTLCGYGKQTIYGMHRGYCGAIENKHKADAYIAMIYTHAAKTRGWIWKKRPKEEDNGE